MPNTHTIRNGLVGLVGSSALVLGLVSTAIAGPVTPSRLLNAQDESHNWLMSYGSYSSHVHSGLSNINTGNVGDLKVRYMMAIGGTAPGPDKEGNQIPGGAAQYTNCVNDGFLYVHNSWGEVTKFDVRSGSRAQPIWSSDPGMEIVGANRGCPVLLNEFVYNKTRDMRLIKIDDASGETLFDVSTLVVYDVDPVNEQSTSDAALAVGNKIIMPQVSRQRRGWIGAFSAEDGSELWHFNTIPRPGEFGHETWADNWGAWKVGGGGVWGGMSYDPETDLVIFGVGDPFPWGDPEFRPGDNLFTSSIVAVNATTGERAWHFQETPNESWDYGSPSPKMLVDIPIGGVDRKVEVHFARNGFFYTIDRATGEFLGGEAFTNVTWTEGLDPKSGLPLNYDPNSLVQSYGRASLRPGQPDTSQGICPYFLGAPTYFKPTYDKSRQMAWSLASDGCMNQSLEVDQYLKTPEFVAEIEAEYPFLWEYELVNDSQTGRIIGVDVLTGEKTQQLVVEHMIYSGLLGTAGGLIFTGHLTGKFAAYDKDNLSELWSFNVGAPISAPPSSFMIDGQQFVAITIGGQDQSRHAGAELKVYHTRVPYVVVFGL